MRTFKLLLFFPLVAAKVLLVPRERAVLRGSAASYNCSISVPWVVMSWLFDGSVGLTISMEHGVLENTPRFTAVNYTTNENYKWEFTIRNVTRKDSGEITCDVQNIQSIRANLSVQEGGTVSILGGNLTVKHGDQAVFVCVASGWFPEAQVYWSMNGTMVDTENYNTSVEAIGTLLNSTSTLTVSAVGSAQVQCLAKVPALFIPQTSSVFLIVETNLQADRTVLIAVTVTFSLAALVVLLLIGIVLYCKRKRAKQSNYQEEVMSHRQSGEENHGKDNPGFTTDGHESYLSNSEAANSSQIPDISQTNSNQQTDFKTHEGMTTTKYRHQTIV
ncbi:immunoglobulin superfamily member 5-like isoform X2 [Clupea harengus]|uniref:immunoglobulin superfamily member 5-like isoform X2 n=1 Tax=Clupea harengus TaxID=7950 RepID=UPI0012ABD5BC|nr:immunoglobulin superfamily member 5-like isoform X2 [Clupea harengus]XP_031427432.1 immunoglobulin superfamily member 5-like isoform X2 [Clupea harengus]